MPVVAVRPERHQKEHEVPVAGAHTAPGLLLLLLLMLTDGGRQSKRSSSQ